MNIEMPELLMYLIGERNLYARIANGLKRVEAPGLGTMAVGIHDGRFTLYWDPEFIKKGSMPFLIFVLEHEMYHLAMDHISRYLELLALLHDPERRIKAKGLYNIAMDCADNTNLRGSKYFEIAKKETRELVRKALPEGTDVDEQAGMVLPENYELRTDGSFEFYLEELMKKCKISVTSGPGGRGPSLTPEEQAFIDKLEQDNKNSVGNSHSKWDEPLSPDKQTGKTPPKTPEELQAEAEKLRTQARQVLRKAVQEQTRDRGLIPGEIADFLESFLADPIVPWWELLTSRVKATQQSKMARGIQRPNRMLLALSEEDRGIIPALGRIRDPRYRVFFMTDTSGSMDDDSLKIACSELSHLLKADDDMEVRWIQGDAAVHFDRLYKQGEEIVPEVYGRGGTDFDAYFEYMWQYVGNPEAAPDLVVVYTDGYAPSVKPSLWLPPEIPVLWLVTRNGAAQELAEAGYGEVIVCSESQNEMWQHAA